MLILFRKLSLTIFLIFSFSFVCYGVDLPDVSASSAILIDGDTLEILYEKNSRQRRSMASTTKIMTSLLAVESGKLDSIVTVKDKIYIEGTAIGLNKGDQLSLRTLCYAMLLESGNDAAVQSARFLANNEKNFSELMNRKAQEIGMNDTNFVTASGLDDEYHYTTAYDMALLGAYSIKTQAFREICSAKIYKAEYIFPDTTRYFSNHNRLLKSCDGAIGIKTGFTKKSGRCLVSACERNGKLLVAVTLNAPDDWNDHKALYDYGYSLYEEYVPKVDLPDKIPVTGASVSEVDIDVNYSSNVLVLKKATIKTEAYLKKITYAPIKKHEIVGKIVVFQNGHPINEDYIISLDEAFTLENYTIYKPGVKERFIKFVKKYLFKER